VKPRLGSGANVVDVLRLLTTLAADNIAWKKTLKADARFLLPRKWLSMRSRPHATVIGG
jgi:hypothetical protein